VLDVPVMQRTRDDDDQLGFFEVEEEGAKKQYRPTLVEDDGRSVLLEDVAHFYRGPNPFNKERTVTLCNGMFSRGTLGAVKSLTDPRFRDRNANYITRRFTDGAGFSILTRIHVVNGAVVTPDWTVAETRLHEWAES
jgi:hypothetical protein